MTYTDDPIDRGDKVKKDHVSELATELDEIASDANLSIGLLQTTYTTIKALNMKMLQTAVNMLEESFSGNCCQADCCQTCQSTTCQTCQSCQRCQSCQLNCNCCGN